MKLNRRLLAFVGPSLPLKEAKALGVTEALPPARQGDMWRALAKKPSAIALIDGVFESQPSVWHQEILSALSSGVAVFGASSMGALRAAELTPFGMVGIGRIYEWVASGVVVDDADVALLHAGKEHGHRPLTAPLVNVRYAAEKAASARVLTPKEARALVHVAEQMFYQERSWSSLRRQMAKAWSKATLAKWDAWAKKGLPDLKREDAIACLRAARAFVDSGAVGPMLDLSAAPPSSHMRVRRILDGDVRGVAPRLRARKDADALREAGATRSLLAALAVRNGLRASDMEVAAAEKAWRRRAGLAAKEMDAAEIQRLCEEVVLQSKALASLHRLMPDAPSDDEALVQEARWRGLW